MTDRDALLAAIRAAPDDDTPRLAYADWLEEHDQREAAEFVRVQVELEPVRHRLEDRRVRELIRREEQIEAEDRDRPFGTAFEDGLSHPEGVGYRRGLPDWLGVSLDTLLARGDWLFAAYPTVRELAVFDFAGRGAELAACPLVAKADVLELADLLRVDDAVALGGSPHLRAVRRFRLYGDWDYEGSLGERLGERATPGWPERVEVVWLFDGLAAGLTAANCDQPLTGDESFAAEVNRLAGRELAIDVRPATGRFPLVGDPFDSADEDRTDLGLDMGYGFYVGRLPDGTPALAAWGTDDWFLVTFDEAGLVRDVDRRPCPVPGIGQQTGPARLEHASLEEEAARAWATSELRLTPAVIRVREFEAVDGLGVHLWPRSFLPYICGDPRPERMPEATWRETGGAVSRWLRKGDFVIDCRGDFWADWRGRIHSS